MMRTCRLAFGPGSVALAATSSLLALSVSSIASAQSVGAAAEGKTASELETITVTARRREESLQSVPVSVVAVTGEELKEHRILDIEAFEANTPGFSFDYLAGTKARPTIRGVGSDEPGAGGDPSSVVFLDGVYQGRQGMMAVDMFDIAQVDLLRGPQGTLWGRNVVGGALNIITAKPSSDFDAMLQATAGNYGTFETQGHVNGAVSDGVNGRLAYSYRTNDGYVKNLFTGNDVYDTDRSSVRGHLQFTLGDRGDLLLTADYTTDDASGLPGIVTRSNTAAAAPAVNANGRWETQASRDGFAKRDMWGVRAELNYDLGFAAFTNILGYRDLDDATSEDWDGTNPTNFPTVPQIDFAFADDATSLSNEARLAGDTESHLNWQAGLYYLLEETDQSSALGLGAARFAWTTANTTRSYAVFGEATQHFTDRFSMTLGGRYTEDQKDYSNVLLSSGTQVFDTGDIDASFDAVTWRASAEFQATEDLFFYMAASKGFKSGAFNSLAFTRAEAAEPLAPEEVRNYEVGMRSQWANNRLIINMTAFTMDYENLQLVQVTGTQQASGLNLPTAEINGLELETTWRPTEGTDIQFRYSYLDSTSESPEGGVIVRGRRLIRTPKSDLSLSVSHEWTFADAASFRVGMQASYTGSMFDDPDNNMLEFRPARRLYDAFATWTSTDAHWEASLWGRNLGEEAYVIRVSNLAGYNQVVVGPPRTYGVTIIRRFN